MGIRILKVLGLLWAVASATMPGVFAVAEAGFEARAASPAAAHVEDQGAPGCPPVHDAGCGVCARLAAASGEPAAAPSLGHPGVRSAVVPAAPPYARPDAWIRHSARPRAPPTA